MAYMHNRQQPRKLGSSEDARKNRSLNEFDRRIEPEKNRLCFIVIQESSMTWMGLEKRAQHPNWTYLYIHKCKQILPVPFIKPHRHANRTLVASYTHTICVLFFVLFSVVFNWNNKKIRSQWTSFDSFIAFVDARLQVQRARMFWIYFWRLDIFISELALTGRNKHR